MRNPPSRIQSNVELLRTCQWHTSALISTAIESVTLPTRLHGTGGIFGSIGDIAAALNTSGRQTIGTLSMALCGVEKSDVNDTMISRPAWRPTETAGAEFSWEPEGRQRRKKKDHVFAQTSIVRGFDPDDEPEQEEADQRKADQRKVTQRPDESDRRKSIFRRWGTRLALLGLPCRAAYFFLLLAARLPRALGCACARDLRKQLS